MRDLLMKTVAILMSEEFKKLSDARPSGGEVPFVWAMKEVKKRLPEEDWKTLESASFFNLASCLTLGDIIMLVEAGE